MTETIYKDADIMHRLDCSVCQMGVITPRGAKEVEELVQAISDKYRSVKAGKNARKIIQSVFKRLEGDLKGKEWRK